VLHLDFFSGKASYRTCFTG